MQCGEVWSQCSSRTMDTSNLPTSFDARQKWKSCISPIKNQKKCSSCWAQTSTSLLSDRLCIASNGNIKKMLSPQQLIDCDKDCKPAGCNKGCGGGYLDLPLVYFKNTGVVTEKCYPYTMANGDCRTTCKDGTSFSNVTKFHVTDCYSLSGIENAMADIMTNGPISATFDLYSDIYKYSGGIYIKSASAVYNDTHAARVIGWGEEGGVKYWIAANSWGTGWGEDGGYFRIRRGTNEVNFEQNFNSATPDTASVPLSEQGSDWGGFNTASSLTPLTTLSLISTIFYFIYFIIHL